MNSEEKILSFWQKRKIFEKSLKNRQKAQKFVFYEGPPFANAKPGLHHILARSYKDVVARYKTMQGFYVGRKAGWDTHGLPVEMAIEKQLGVSSKPEIEKIGVEKFVKLCSENIFSQKKEWEKMTERIGYWLDLKNAYITCQNQYIESVWWILKQIFEKGLIYEDFKVVPYCPRCGTALSDHEVALGYKDVSDPSIFVKFKPVADSQRLKANLLVWTTTPWTLPGNVALAVNSQEKYVVVKLENETLILAKKRVSVLGKKYQIIKEFSGKELVGLKYQPLYQNADAKNAYQVVAADFVNLDEGTGIVHIAPAFGADDLKLAKKEKLPILHTVSLDGKYQGQFVKKADQKIMAELEERKLLYRRETIIHSYPFCWRCDTPLLYYAKNAWYIKTTAVAKKMLDANQSINWIPVHIKNGRFGNWLKENVDWNISRERYWGTPIPFWRCDSCRHTISIGSIAELQEHSIKPINIKNLDLHRPYIDEITLKCPKCSGKMTRVKEVLDVWFDSGAMPYASWHYPFENKEKFQENFPADFIAEGIDQTRGWFYTLLAISTLLNQKPAYKNVIALGLLLDEKNQKMSKSKGNVIVPEQMIDKYGADGVRFYFYLSPQGETIRFSEKDLAEVYRKFIITLKNSLVFYQTYKNKNQKSRIKNQNLLDKWIFSKLNQTIFEATNSFEKYDITKAARSLYSFVTDDLSNWYIRRSRKREDGQFYQNLKEILLTLAKIIAPFTPFIAEEIYQDLSGEKESVHLEDWPIFSEKKIDSKLNHQMEKVRKICEVGLSIRAENQIKVRQPLAELKIEDKGLSGEKELVKLIKDELNVKEVTVGSITKLGKNWQVKSEAKIALNLALTPVLKTEGLLREVVRHIQILRKEEGLKATSQIVLLWDSNEEEIVDIFSNFAKNIEKETKSKLQKSSKADKEILVNGKKLKLKVKS